MNNIQLTIALKEKLKNLFTFAMFCTLSVFSLNLLAETGAIPSKGMTQDQVKATFGEPLSIKPAVGKPPITRWDYQGYSVYFEEKYVIHSFYQNKQLNIQPSQAKSKPETSATKVETVPEPSASIEPSVPMESSASTKPSDTTTASEEAPAMQEENIVEEQVPVEIENTVEEVIVEEIPEAVVEEIPEVMDEPVEQIIEEEIEQKVEENIDTTKKVEEVKVEEVKIEEVVTEETEKDLNFEEPEKPADYNKWGY